MKTAEEHIWALVDAIHEDRPGCCCERCKNGRELFILPSDIRAIQADALRHAAKICQDEGDIFDGPGACCYLATARIEAEAQRLEAKP